MQNVLDSVISALLEDSNRKFIYVEMVPIFCFFFKLCFLFFIWVLVFFLNSTCEGLGVKVVMVEKFVQAFFERWWRQQSEGRKVKVKELVNSGQLEFMYD